MPRRHRSLVCQHIENLPGKALALYADMIRKLVSRQHGIYALYKRDRLSSVGLATVSAMAECSGVASGHRASGCGKGNTATAMMCVKVLNDRVHRPC